MTREEIEQAADEHAEKSYLKQETDLVSHSNGFVAGVEWLSKKAWHDVNEKPDKESAYIVIKYGYNLQTVYWSDILAWEEFQLIYKFTSWTYIEDLDLLPITEDKP